MTLSVIALVKSVLLVKRVDDVRNDDENEGTAAVRVMVTEPAPVLIAPRSIIVDIAYEPPPPPEAGKTDLPAPPPE